MQQGYPSTRSVQPLFTNFGVESVSRIAAAAKIHGLTVVTRNVADFMAFGVPLLDPFEAMA